MNIQVRLSMDFHFSFGKVLTLSNTFQDVNMYALQYGMVQLNVFLKWDAN